MEVTYGGRYGGKKTHWWRVWLAVLEFMHTPYILHHLSVVLQWASELSSQSGEVWRQEEAFPKTSPPTS